MRKCGTCGKPGHNARTCSKKRVKAEKPKGRACGNCGELGHNRRTCPQAEKAEEQKPVPEEVEEVEEVVVMRPQRKRRVRKCKSCGEEGHKAQNCPYKPVPEGTTLGPSKMECGHSSWWLEDGECIMCTKALFTRNYAKAA